MALRRVTGAAPAFFSGLLNGRLSVVRCTPLALRCFNTNAQLSNYNEDDRSVDIDRRSDSTAARRRDSAPSFFSEALDPFAPPRSLSQMLNLMDQFMDNPFLAASRGVGAGPRRGWDVKEDENALFLRMDMPGLGKEDVKISVEQNTLVVKGEGAKEWDDEEDGARRYSSRLDIPPKLYKMDSIKAEMNNGVLKIKIPKVKEEEREDVFQVKIE
ncbi:small heat shock protein, chloroplastic-like isoform X2 [Prosopis cineraria]|uniref:small heat shock protein, chloroplastic-like isoform X2 n=1 Tax=Prosopis cineraria TaxID=364024 RepID=UPI00240F6CC6|nr:small heat shock protein, chloroplastic-like isoform X2 [Prosopis cineraria]